MIPTFSLNSQRNKNWNLRQHIQCIFRLWAVLHLSSTTLDNTQSGFVHTCNPNIMENEAEGSEAQEQPGLGCLARPCLKKQEQSFCQSIRHFSLENSR